MFYVLRKENPIFSNYGSIDCGEWFSVICAMEKIFISLFLVYFIIFFALKIFVRKVRYFFLDKKFPEKRDKIVCKITKKKQNTEKKLKKKEREKFKTRKKKRKLKKRKFFSSKKE